LPLDIVCCFVPSNTRDASFNKNQSILHYSRCVSGNQDTNYLELVNQQKLKYQDTES
jgi:hypothetical protein